MTDAYFKACRSSWRNVSRKCIKTALIFSFSLHPNFASNWWRIIYAYCTPEHFRCTFVTMPVPNFQKRAAWNEVWFLTATQSRSLLLDEHNSSIYDRFGTIYNYIIIDWNARICRLCHKSTKVQLKRLEASEIPYLVNYLIKRMGKYLNTECLGKVIELQKNCNVGK